MDFQLLFTEILSIINEKEEKIRNKKLLSIMLSAAMVMSMRVNSFASNNSNQAYYESLNWGYMFSASNAYISCGFKGYTGHKGFDLAVAGGTAIKNPSLGYVSKVFYNTDDCGYGLAVETVYSDPDTNKDLVNTSMHMQAQPNWSVGDMVYKTNVLGYVGTTGNSTGNHLHMQVSKDGTWYGSGSVNNFINPIYFFPNINFTGDTTIRSIAPTGDCCVAIISLELHICSSKGDIPFGEYMVWSVMRKGGLRYNSLSHSHKTIQY